MNTLPQGLEIGKIINKLSDRIGGNFTTISGAWSAATLTEAPSPQRRLGWGSAFTLSSVLRVVQTGGIDPRPMKLLWGLNQAVLIWN